MKSKIDYKEIREATAEGVVMIAFLAEMSDASQKFNEEILQELKKKFEFKIDFYVIDVDEYPESSNDYDIQMIPTVGIFENSKPKIKIEGMHPLEFYVERLGELLKNV